MIEKPPSKQLPTAVLSVTFHQKKCESDETNEFEVDSQEAQYDDTLSEKHVPSDYYVDHDEEQCQSVFSDIGTFGGSEVDGLSLSKMMGSDNRNVD